MKVNIRFALLSFCGDLTDPSAVARPLAVVGAARIYLPRSRKKDLAFYLLRNAPETDPGLPQDAMTQSVLKGLPGLFDRQILVGLTEAGVDRFLPWLQNRFRNSLHVSSTGERSLELREEQDVLTACMRLYSELVLGQRLPRPPAGSHYRSQKTLPAEAPPAFMIDGFSFKVRPIEPGSMRAVG